MNFGRPLRRPFLRQPPTAYSPQSLQIHADNVLKACLQLTDVHIRRDPPKFLPMGVVRLRALWRHWVAPGIASILDWETRRRRDFWARPCRESGLGLVEDGGRRGRVANQWLAAARRFALTSRFLGAETIIRRLPHVPPLDDAPCRSLAKAGAAAWPCVQRDGRIERLRS